MMVDPGQRKFIGVISGGKEKVLGEKIRDQGKANLLS